MAGTANESRLPKEYGESFILKIALEFGDMSHDPEWFLPDKIWICALCALVESRRRVFIDIYFDRETIQSLNDPSSTEVECSQRSRDLNETNKMVYFCFQNPFFLMC